MQAHWRTSSAYAIASGHSVPVRAPASDPKGEKFAFSQCEQVSHEGPPPAPLPLADAVAPLDAVALVLVEPPAPPSWHSAAPGFWSHKLAHAVE